MKSKAASPLELPLLRCFAKFCLVGGLGVIIDMLALSFLTNPQWGHLNIGWSKLWSAEIALLHNFLWNEAWTFKSVANAPNQPGGALRRLARFHVICGLGIALSLYILKTLYEDFQVNLYFANSLAILTATLWNFLLNATINWHIPGRQRPEKPPVPSRIPQPQSAAGTI